MSVQGRRQPIKAGRIPRTGLFVRGQHELSQYPICPACRLPRGVPACLAGGPLAKALAIPPAPSQFASLTAVLAALHPFLPSGVFLPEDW